MVPKIIHWVGLAACIMLVAICFLPWTYYADIRETFTGFYSYNNQYGKPGKFLSFAALLSFLLLLFPKVWAKRVNLFLCALVIGYAIKTYILYTSCYNAYCPEKKSGIFLMLACSILMMLAAIFPDLKLSDSKKSNGVA